MGTKADLFSQKAHRNVKQNLVEFETQRQLMILGELNTAYPIFQNFTAEMENEIIQTTEKMAELYVRFAENLNGGSLDAERMRELFAASNLINPSPFAEIPEFIDAQIAFLSVNMHFFQKALKCGPMTKKTTLIEAMCQYFGSKKNFQNFLFDLSNTEKWCTSVALRHAKDPDTKNILEKGAPATAAVWEKIGASLFN